VLADYQVQVLLRNEAGHSVDDVWRFDNAAYVFHARALDDIAAGDAPFPGSKTDSARPQENTWDFWWWYAIIQRRAVALVIPVMLLLVGGGALAWRAVIGSARADPRNATSSPGSAPTGAVASG